MGHHSGEEQGKKDQDNTWFFRLKIRILVFILRAKEANRDFKTNVCWKCAKCFGKIFKDNLGNQLKMAEYGQTKIFFFSIKALKHWQKC